MKISEQVNVKRLPREIKKLSSKIVKVKKLPRQIHKEQSWWRLPGWGRPTSLGSDDDKDNGNDYVDYGDGYDDYDGDDDDYDDDETWFEMKRVLSGQRLS